MSGQLAGGIGLLLVMITLAMVLDSTARAAKVRLRVSEVAERALGGHAASTAPKGGALALTGLVAAFGSAIASSGLLPAKTRAELERTLRTSGVSTAKALGLFIGAKVGLALALPAATFAATRSLTLQPLVHLGLLGGSAVAGLIGPDLIIGHKRQAYLKSVEKGLADGLDMMVICAEAGLALDAAIRRVSTEIVHAHPELAEELATTCNELTLVADPRVALTNIGARTGLTSFERLGATLIQSVEYGTPLASALRILAGELRQETLTRFEERAARLPVLLTIPMILFILPCVFLIVAGPIVVQVVKAMAR